MRGSAERLPAPVSINMAWCKEGSIFGISCAQEKALLIYRKAYRLDWKNNNDIRTVVHGLGE